MSTINTVGDANTKWLVQQLARATSKQVLNNDQSLPVSTTPVSDNSAAPKLDGLNMQLASLLKKLSEGKQAINIVGSATQEINQSKKATAAEELKRIKEQIRMMMMLTAGDPKARARQIAVLARELAAAAQEYASATGNPSQSREASASAAAAGAGIQNANTSSAEQSNPAGATDAATQTDQNTGSAAPETSSATTTSPAEPTTFQPISTHQVNEQLANRISEYSQTSSSSKEDQEFAMEVRKLAAQLKSLAKQNEVRTHKGADQSTELETANTNEALREVEHSLAIIDSPNVSNTPTINVVAS